MKKENTKDSLLSKWKNRNKTSTPSNTISKAPDNIRLPLSNGQQRLWFLQQLYPQNTFYNYAETYVLKGILNTDFLIKSLQKVYADHTILRSTYQIEDGKVFQEINEKVVLPISQYNYCHLEQVEAEKEAHKIMHADANFSFNLTDGPLIRVSLIQLHKEHHILQLTLHHIVTDKWSMGIFRDQLAAHYRALIDQNPAGFLKTEIQYVDYAYWQQNTEVSSKGIEYWKKKLSGELAPLDIPTDYKRPIRSSFKGAFNVQELTPRLSKEVLALSRKMDVTPYVFLLSVYYLLLFRYTGQKDVLIGSPIANRDQKALEGIIGFFNDTVVLRTELEPSMSFETLVKMVKETTMQAFTHKNVPFDLLVKTIQPQRSLSSNPFFEVMFLYHAVPPTPNFGEGLELAHDSFDTGVSKFDLTLYIAENNGQLSATFEYATDLFKEATIQRFQEYFKLLLEGVVENPQNIISNIPMETAMEKQLFFYSDAANQNPFENYAGIHKIIEEICQQYPDKKAVSYLDKSISYKELDQQSELIAKKLLAQTKAVNGVIGLCMDRSLEMIIGLLAILKAGQAYLPIDPDYPPQRMSYILEDAKADIILTETKLNDFFKEIDIPIICIDELDITGTVDNISLPAVTQDQLAYIIYTSGSTGQPKGVPITHRNIIQSTMGRLDFYDQNPTAFLLMSSISFDSSKAGIFWTLCTGGNLVISEKRIEQDIEEIAATIQKNKVSHTLMLPSLYQLILEHVDSARIGSLTTVMVAGEACSSNVCKEHFKVLPEVKLYNEYGPTEATVWCIAHQILREDIINGVPIGKPVANAKIYLLNSDMEKVPFGAKGEIYIGGPGLTKEYINRSELSNSVLVDDPFSKVAGEKLYKTGDLARYRSDGCIQFLGRLDQQVKIRGYRIELDEIEKVILEHPLVDKAVLMAETATIHLSEHIENSTDPEELLTLLERYLTEVEINELLDSVASLDSEEKKYVLQQLS